jgi:hypothetical protein
MPAIQPDPGGSAGEPTAGVTLPPLVDAAAVTE